MTWLPDGLLARLARSRLQPHWTQPISGVGERSSRTSGSGMEFAQHRPYQPGDDLRHVDRHAYARFGKPVVKEFDAERQLHVTLLLDQSASMAFGQPSKLSLARALAEGLAYIALSGGDRLLLGTFVSADSVRWHPSVSGARRYPQVLRWLEENVTDDASAADGETDLVQLARALGDRRSSAGMLFVLTDGWTGQPEEAVRALVQNGYELVLVHLLDDEFFLSAADSDGVVRLVDAETGDALDVVLDAAAHMRYRQELEAWSSSWRRSVEAVQGRYLAVRTDIDLERLLLYDWRRAGLIG